MSVPFELHIALRYLLARRKQAFISVISSISTLGVIVGVMAVVIALALMTGLQQELRDRIQRGDGEGSDVLACGMPITTRTGHCHWLGLIAEGEAAAAQAA